MKEGAHCSHPPTRRLANSFRNDAMLGAQHWLLLWQCGYSAGAVARSALVRGCV